MTKSIRKSEANNNSKGPEGASSNTLGPGSAPVSVVVDVVSHDEPSVCSNISNGLIAHHDTTVCHWRENLPCH